MAPKIETPVAGFTGVVAGVSFAAGVGETEDPAALAFFARRGYTIAAEEAGEKLTPNQKLQAEAAELGLEAEGTVDEIKARITEHKANAEKTPADPETPPAGDDPKDPGNADGDTGGE